MSTVSALETTSFRLTGYFRTNQQQMTVSIMAQLNLIQSNVAALTQKLWTA